MDIISECKHEHLTGTNGPYKCIDCNHKMFFRAYYCSVVDDFLNQDCYYNGNGVFGEFITY